MARSIWAGSSFIAAPLDALEFLDRQQQLFVARQRRDQPLAAQFGQVAVIRGKPIEGHFDESTEFLDDLGPVPIQSTAPQFQCQTSELPDDVGEGEPITVTRTDGSLFSGTVVTSEPDGFGLIVMRLQKK